MLNILSHMFISQEPNSDLGKDQCVDGLHEAVREGG